MKEELLYSGPIFDLIKKDFLINGKYLQRDIILHHGGVGLLCVKDGKVLLVSQERQAADKKNIEIPAGKLEKGEDALKAGIRELNEETGYACKSTKLLTAFYPTPGYSSEKIWVYQCFDVEPVKERLPMDADEDIACFWMDLDEAFQKIQDGTIDDGKTIIAILFAMLEKKEGK